MNKIKKAVQRLISLFAAVLILLCNSVEAYAIGNCYAFSTNAQETIESFSEAYGWNADVIRTKAWTVTYGDGSELAIQRLYGYQYEYLVDNIQLTLAYLDDYCTRRGIDYEIRSSGEFFSNSISGSGGRAMAALARSQVGAAGSVESPAKSNNVKYNTWYYGSPVSGSDYQWCCVFVTWCANQLGYVPDLFSMTAWCPAQYENLASDKGFSTYRVFNTVPFGGSYLPEPGDIMFFTPSGIGSTSEHIGIVVDCTESELHVVEGNTTGQGNVPGGGVWENIYTSANAPVRVKNGIIVHVEYPDDTKTIFRYLTEAMGFNAAAACGMMANLEAESDFDPAHTGEISEDDSEIEMGYGICQWGTERKANLIDWCTENDYAYTTLEGQLAFMAYEIGTEQYDSIMQIVDAVENTEDGAYNAAVALSHYFDSLRLDDGAESVARGNVAKNSYWQQYGAIS